MSCWLCGHESDDAHHLGCARIYRPNLTKDEARKEGLMPPPPHQEVPPPANTQVLKDGSMTTVPVDENQDQDPAEDASQSSSEDEKPDVAECEVEDCHNPKYSDSPRTKYCAEHKDPKNRKE